jgi:formylmethanofuran dehydrogenase subunit E
MTDKDNKNLDIISGIVKKYFFLEDSSNDFFEKALRNPIADKTAYKFLLDSPDFRARFPFSSEYYKEMDQGWKYFQQFFPQFLLSNECTYLQYRENKIIYKGNEVKLKKAIIDWYFKNKTSMGQMLRIPTETAKIMPKEDLERNVIEKMEKVGAYKLPIKSEMEVVMSLNFADWFLCSTAESWGSCINLESDFHGSFWTGLPGLTGDPNRCILYVTDRNKKEYLGIETEKILSRTWVLIDNFDKYFAIRYFPQSILNIDALRKTINLPITNFDEFRGDFTAKHPITPLWFKNGKNSFIYQDHCKFEKGKKIIRAMGEGSLWSFDKNEKISNGNIFTYKGGLKRLVSENMSLERYASKICEKCGGPMNEPHEFDGALMCRNCYSKFVTQCNHCGDAYWKTDTKQVHGSYVCKKCLEKYYTSCEDCNEFMKKDELIFLHDLKKYVCNNCLENYETVHCEHCGKVYANKDGIHEMFMPAAKKKTPVNLRYAIKEDTDKAKKKEEQKCEMICIHCLKKLWDVGQLKFDFTKTVNVNLAA